MPLRVKTQDFTLYPIGHESPIILADYDHLETICLPTLFKVENKSISRKNSKLNFVGYESAS